MVKILGICGSLREPSVTRQMVERVLDASRQQSGVETELLDLKDYALPFCDGRLNNDDSYGPVVTALRKKVKEADAFVVGTPQYHGGYSGVLKNFLDLNCGQVFKDKWVALVGAAGGRLGGESALNQLMEVFKTLNAICLPTQATVGKSDVSDGQITNPMVLARLDAMGRQLAQWAQRMRQPAA